MKIIKDRKGDGGAQVEQYLKNKKKDGQFLIKISPRISYSYFSVTMQHSNVVVHFTSITMGERKAERGRSLC